MRFYGTPHNKRKTRVLNRKRNKKSLRRNTSTHKVQAVKLQIITGQEDRRKLKVLDQIGGRKQEGWICQKHFRRKTAMLLYKWYIKAKKNI